ncbi:DUF1330 domain-containing protein [Phenylobacterium sp.]|uniref:DUF1330 domain-containing protein n=1 Tax=Phenylobacterium sp. TaxID=1871053 RepID=UPI0025D5EFF0|nr:DUF1330 domain-containing protein [Phenylobacterium sp.]
MTVYIVGHLAIRDRERYAQYEAGFMPVLQQYGGRLVAVNDAPAVLEGVADGRRLVILSFEDQAAALTWVRSPEYRAIAKHRHAASEAFILMTEGFA